MLKTFRHEDYGMCWCTCQWLQGKSNPAASVKHTDYESQKWNKVPKRALVGLGFGRDLLRDTGQFTSGISFASCRYFFTLELCSAWTGLAPALVPAGFLKWGFGHPKGQMAPPQTAHKAGSHCPPAENPHRPLLSAAPQQKSATLPRVFYKNPQITSV